MQITALRDMHFARVRAFVAYNVVFNSRFSQGADPSVSQTVFSRGANLSINQLAGNRGRMSASVLLIHVSMSWSAATQREAGIRWTQAS